MANVGPNKGRRLRLALSRFSAMLIEEARDLSGLAHPKLDEVFGFHVGKCQRYALYPPRPWNRAPQADEIQNLENLVARLLKRPAHVVVIEDNTRFVGNNDLLDVVVGPPDAGLDLRAADETDLELRYEDDWPTYRRLKYSSPRNGITLLDLYAWQYGIFWDKGILPDPWTREALGIPANVPVDVFLPGLVEEMKAKRLAHLELSQLWCQVDHAIEALSESIIASSGAGILPELAVNLESTPVISSEQIPCEIE